MIIVVRGMRYSGLSTKERFMDGMRGLIGRKLGSNPVLGSVDEGVNRTQVNIWCRSGQKCSAYWSIWNWGLKAIAPISWYIGKQ